MHNSDADVNRHGIYRIENGHENRIGAYQPGKRVSELIVQPYCWEFLFDPKSNETLCIKRFSGGFELALIRSDGAISLQQDYRLFNTSFFPKRLQDGKILVPTPPGKIIDIHEYINERGGLWVRNK